MGMSNIMWRDRNLSWMFFCELRAFVDLNVVLVMSFVCKSWRRNACDWFKSINEVKLYNYKLVTNKFINCLFNYLDFSKVNKIVLDSTPIRSLKKFALN